MPIRIKILPLLLFTFVAAAVLVDAQTNKKIASPKAATPTPVPAKKNERPGSDTVKPIETAQTKASKPTYFYEFTQPNFVISKILIEHDAAGKGKITFAKRDNSEMITDPLELSAVTLEKINQTLAELDFYNSDTNYQYEKDYSHLGTNKFRMLKGGRERSTTFNWTQNADAKSLADEYRRISNQLIWQFDINVARENQPLEAPKLLDSLDSLIRRNEISDPKQMTPFLQKLSNDERIPLIARNHSAKLIKQIEKEKK